MSTTRKIAHNTLSQVIGKAISTILGLVAIAMMTRYLGTEQFGWYITTISFLQFIGILIDFGLIPVTAQMMSEKAHDKKQLLQNLLGFRFVTAFIFLGLAPLVAFFFPYPIEVKLAISFTTISFLAVAMNQVLIGYYQTKLKMHVVALGEVIGRVALVVGLWLVMTQGAGFLPIMAIVTIGSVLYTLFLWIYAYQSESAGFGFDTHIWKAIMTKSWPIAISIMFNVVYLKGDVIILSLYGTQDMVGLYGAAYRVVDVLAQMAMMIMGVMLPLMAYQWSRNIKEKFKIYYQQSFDVMMLLAVPAMVGVILLAEPIMVLVAGVEFAGSAIALQILSVAVFGVYLGAVFGHASVAINKQKQVMWIFISDAVITLIGYLIFIPMYGMLGAAWMTVFSELYAGILLWIMIRKYSNTPLQFKAVNKIIFATLIMALVLWLLHFLPVLVLVLLGACTYGATLYLIGGISRDTIKEILKV